MFPLLADLVDETVLVTEQEVRAMVKRIYAAYQKRQKEDLSEILDQISHRVAAIYGPRTLPRRPTTLIMSGVAIT